MKPAAAHDDGGVGWKKISIRSEDEDIGVFLGVGVGLIRAYPVWSKRDCSRCIVKGGPLA